MSFDPFQARLDFLQLLRKLNASQPSIQKVVAFALRYGSRCGEDLWECIVEECGKGSLNTRINILYFLDSLLDSSQSLSPREAPYPDLVTRDIQDIVRNVVPDTREGVLNSKSARQILESWRTRRLVEPDVVDAALTKLEERKREAIGSPKKRSHETFSKQDILRRMEEDRERHKRLRERIWILPIPPLNPSKRPSRPSSSLLGSTSSNPNNANASANQSPASGSPLTPASPSVREAKDRLDRSGTGVVAAGASTGSMPPPPIPPPVGKIDPAGQPEQDELSSALDVEFEQVWEGAGVLGEEDYKRMRENSRVAQASRSAMSTY